MADVLAQQCDKHHFDPHDMNQKNHDCFLEGFLCWLSRAGYAVQPQGGHTECCAT